MLNPELQNSKGNRFLDFISDIEEGFSKDLIYSLDKKFTIIMKANKKPIKLA